MVFFVFCPAVLFAQNHFYVKGNVRDEKSEPVYGVQVFVNGTSKSAVTDSAGNFRLSALPPGNYEVVFHILGYKTLDHWVTIEQKDVILNTTLEYMKRSPTCCRTTIPQNIRQGHRNKDRLLQTFNQHNFHRHRAWWRNH